MSRREYDIKLIFNGIEIKKVIIDPHYELRHTASITDDIILKLIQKVDGVRMDPVAIEGQFSYFVRDKIEMSGKLYKLIWLLEKEAIYIGIINAYRR